MKSTLAFCIGALSLIDAHAQEFVVKAGVSMSSVSVSGDFAHPGYEFTMKAGFTAGLAVAWPVAEKFAFQAEALFIQKGWEDKLEVDGVHHSDVFTINYMEIPLLMKYKISPFFVNAGAFLASGIGGSYTSYDGFPGSESEGKIVFGDWPSTGSGSEYLIHNRFDAGFIVGGGIKIKKLVVVDVRYERALTNFMDSEGYYKTKNFSFVLTAGVCFARSK